MMNRDNFFYSTDYRNTVHTLYPLPLSPPSFSSFFSFSSSLPPPPSCVLHRSNAGWSHGRLHPVHWPADRGARAVLPCVPAHLPHGFGAAGSDQRHAVQAAAGARQAEEHRAGAEEEAEQEG